MGEVQGEKAHLPYFFARLFRAMPQLTERLEEANLCLVTHVRHVSIIFQFRPKSYSIFKDIFLLCFAFCVFQGA